MAIPVPPLSLTDASTTVPQAYGAPVYGGSTGPFIVGRGASAGVMDQKTLLLAGVVLVVLLLIKKKG